MTRYNCEEAFRRLDDYLDRELSEEEMHLVHDHLQTCGLCAREFAFEAQVLEEVRSKLNRIEIPPALRSRLIDLVAEERKAAGG